MNNVGILQEMITFGWETIWFDNLYYEDNLAPNYQAPEIDVYREVEIIQKIEILDEWAVPDITYSVPSKWDHEPIAMLMGVQDRFSDFFDYYSKTQLCKRFVKVAESRLIKVLEYNFTDFSENSTLFFE